MGRKHLLEPYHKLAQSLDFANLIVMSVVLVIVYVVSEISEMIKGLRALAALTEDSGLFPAPTWWITSVCNSSSTESRTFVWPLWVTGTHTVHLHR